MQEQFSGHKNAYHHFSSTPYQERASYYQTVLSAEQEKSSPPQLFLGEYQSHAEFEYQGLSLNYYLLENTDHPAAILVHFHGLNSHGGASAYYAQVISEHSKDINIYALDQMNFGRSEGPCRGLITSLQDSARQGEAFVDYLLSKFDKKPKAFLSGSSFGGTIVFKMGLIDPQKYAGAVLLAPALRDVYQSKKYLKKLNSFLTWIIPRVHIPIPLSSKEVTKYNCDELIRNDPYYYKSGLVPASISAVLNAMEEVSKEYSSFTLPFIIFQGGHDKSVDLFAPLDLQKQSPSPHKQIIYYQNLWHSVFYEEQIEDISRRAAEWIGKMHK